MSKYSTLIKRVSNATAATALTLASLTPAVMLGGTAKAAQLSARSITMTDSAAGNASTYDVAFTNTGNYASVKIEICDSPIFDDGCSTSTIAVGIDMTGDANQVDANTVVIDDTVTSAGPRTYSITVDNNPTTANTFYAQISTYTLADAAGSLVDSGSVAMVTTDDLTISAKVKEVLEFCVGSATTAYIVNNISTCANVTNSPIYLGVLDTTIVTDSSSNSNTSGDDHDGVFAIRTNAANGATVSYWTRQESGSGALKVAGAACDSPASLVDQCIDSAAGLASLTAGTEKFGMKVTTSPAVGNTLTSNLDSDQTSYRWNDTDTPYQVANSNQTVMAWEKAILNFNATASYTTPTGSYQTIANFVATATF